MFIAVESGQIVLKDPGYSCQTYCGAHNSIDDHRFALSARKPIQDMQKLKSSAEYSQAAREVEQKAGKQH